MASFDFCKLPASATPHLRLSLAVKTRRIIRLDGLAVDLVDCIVPNTANSLRELIFRRADSPVHNLE